MLLQLAATTDKLQLVTGAAATVDVHASYMDASNADPPVVKGSTSGRQNTAITTATTTDVVAAPAASTLRGVKSMFIRNKHASVATDVTIVFNQNATLFELHKANLAPGEALEYIEGVGFFKLAAAVPVPVGTAKSTASQTGFAADTYVTGSFILFPSVPVIGLRYEMYFDITKTAAGTATPIIIIRTGTAGTTADTARCTFTFGPGTAVADTALVRVAGVFKSVGGGTAAVIVGRADCACLPSSGWSSTIKAVSAVSSGFDSTVANTGIGVSYNGGASAAHTIQQVTANLDYF